MTAHEMAAPQDDITRRDLLRLTLVAAGATLLSACAQQENGQLGEPIEPHIAMQTKEVTGETDLLQTGSWQNTPGVQPVPHGLELTPTGLSIIDKRAGGQLHDNPPLELFGPRLQAAGDFAVSARIQGGGPASLQCYGQVPQRFDDFRYERGRVECRTAGNTLTVRIWDGSAQTPSLQNFPFEGSSADRTIEMRRVGSELAFIVNGKQVGGAPKGSIFAPGAVWLGLNSEQGKTQASSLTTTPLNGHKLEIVDTSSLHVTQSLPEGLQSLVHKPNFRIGSAVALGPLVADERYAQLVLGGELGGITIENSLKPQDVQPLPGVFTFGEAEALVTLAERHELVIHGHTLVYDKAMPEWMQRLPFTTETDKQHLREVLETHIKTTVGRFKGRIASWDVVNEAIGGFNQDAKLINNIFEQAFGEEYLDIAFRAAHEADPAAKLFINDYGLETNPQGRGQFMLALVKRLLARGVPIHGVGIQGHVYKIPRDTIKPQVLRQEMAALHDLGLEVRVSELDVIGANGRKAQADQYASVLRECLAAPNCTGLTIWGMDDLHGSTAGLKGNVLQFGTALPYTTDYRPKLARQTMRDILRAA